MATAPTQNEIYAGYKPPVGPPNHPYVTASQYHKKLLEMGVDDDAQAYEIEKVADELGIPFEYAFRLQHAVDTIKNNAARDAHDAFQITSGTSKRTQPYYKGGRKSRRYSKKSGRKSRRHSKKSSKRSCRR